MDLVFRLIHPFAQALLNPQCRKALYKNQTNPCIHKALHQPSVHPFICFSIHLVFCQSIQLCVLWGVCGFSLIFFCFHLFIRGDVTNRQRRYTHFLSASSFFLTCCELKLTSVLSEISSLKLSEERKKWNLLSFPAITHYQPRLWLMLLFCLYRCTEGPFKGKQTLHHFYLYICVYITCVPQLAYLFSSIYRWRTISPLSHQTVMSVMSQLCPTPLTLNLSTRSGKQESILGWQERIKCPWFLDRISASDWLEHNGFSGSCFSDLSVEVLAFWIHAGISVICKGLLCSCSLWAHISLNLFIRLWITDDGIQCFIALF